MTVSAYIAAPYPARADALELMRELQALGVVITSTWLTTDDPTPDSEANARRDLADVKAALLFVALNPESWANRGTGGRHVEMGYAIALEKPIVIVGERTNVFHHLSEIATVVRGAEALHAIITTLQESGE